MKEMPKMNQNDENVGQEASEAYEKKDNPKDIGIDLSSASLFPPFQYNKHADQRSYHSFFSSGNSNNPDQ